MAAIEVLPPEVPEEPQEDYRKPLYRQCAAASGHLLLTACGALVSGFSTVLLDQLEHPDSPIKPSKFQESLIASLAPLPMAAGCICGGFLMEALGRVNCSVVACLLTTVGWMTIHLSPDVGWLLTGRLITGFCVGLTSPGPTCYLGEIAHPRYRGVFLAGTVLGVAVGFLVAHVLGTFMAWRSLALLGSMLPFVCVVLICRAPESHVWLLKKGRRQRAEEAFHWFRGYGAEARDELEKLMTTTENTTTTSFKETCGKGSGRFWMPLIILNLYFITVQFSGNNVIVYYSIGITRTTVPGINKYLATIIADLVRVAMCAVGCVLTKKHKVRTLTAISGYGASLSLLLLSIIVYKSDKIPQDVLLSTLPMLLLVSFIGFVNVGLRLLPWTLCGEIFDPASKGLGGGICTSVNFLAFFLVVQTNPALTESAGTSGAFFTYAVVTGLGTTALLSLVPETKDKTLKEIDDYFRKQEGRPFRVFQKCCCFKIDQEVRENEANSSRINEYEGSRRYGCHTTGRAQQNGRNCALCTTGNCENCRALNCQ